MDVEGGCLCGSVRYRLAGEPLSSIICHCHTCRKASAAPAVGWLTFARTKFVLLSGSLRSFSSSPGVTRTFCAECGTPLTYRSDENPETIDVTTVSLDDPARFPPTREVWLEYKLRWAAKHAALRHHERGDEDEAKGH